MTILDSATMKEVTAGTRNLIQQLSRASRNREDQLPANVYRASAHTISWTISPKWMDCQEQCFAAMVKRRVRTSGTNFNWKPWGYSHKWRIILVFPDHVMVNLSGDFKPNPSDWAWCRTAPGAKKRWFQAKFRWKNTECLNFRAKRER